MALKAFIAKFRFNRKVSQEISNADQTTASARSWKPAFMTGFALAFCALLTSLANIGQGAAADTTFTLPNFNFTPIGTMLGSLIDAGTVVATPWQNFLNGWVGPAIETIVVVAVMFLIIYILVVGPAKVIGAIEAMINEVAKRF